MTKKVKIYTIHGRILNRIPYEVTEHDSEEHAINPKSHDMHTRSGQEILPGNKIQRVSDVRCVTLLCLVHHSPCLARGMNLHDLLYGPKPNQGLGFDVICPSAQALSSTVLLLSTGRSQQW